MYNHFFPWSIHEGKTKVMIKRGKWLWSAPFMYTICVLLCLVVLRYRPIPCMVYSTGLFKKQYDCPSSGESVLKDICDYIKWITITITVIYSTVYSDADQRKHQSSASLAFVQAIHRGPVNYPHKWPVMRTMFLFDDVIMPRIYNITIKQTKT